MTPFVARIGLLFALLACGPALAQGVAFVSSEKDNALTVIDLKTLAVTGTVALLVECPISAI